MYKGLGVRFAGGGGGGVEPPELPLNIKLSKCYVQISPCFLFILNYPIHIDTINEDLVILYFKGPSVYKMMYFCP